MKSSVGLHFAYCYCLLFFSRAFADTEKPYNFALPFCGMAFAFPRTRGEVLEKIEIVGEILKRPTRTDCKSVDLCLHRFESCSPHRIKGQNTNAKISNKRV